MCVLGIGLRYEKVYKYRTIVVEKNNSREEYVGFKPFMNTDWSE